MAAKDAAIVFVLLVATAIAVVAALKMDDPVHEGHITNKDYTPGHFISTGKTMVWIPASWGFSIAGCDAGMSHCGTGYYGVSEGTYNAHKVGDYVSFSKPNPITYAAIRLVLALIGGGILWLTWWLGQMFVEDLTGNSLWVNGFMTLVLLVCLGGAEFFIFLATKGPDGII